MVTRVNGITPVKKTRRPKMVKANPISSYVTATFVISCCAMKKERPVGVEQAEACKNQTLNPMEKHGMPN